MKSLFIFLLVLFTVPAIAQFNGKVFASDMQRVDNYIRINEKTSSYSLPKNYNGSPYMQENFVPGNIYKGDKLIGYNTPMRYNIFSNEIEVKESFEQSNEEAKPLTKSSDIFVKINKVIIVLVPFNGSDEEGAYFQVLYEGKKLDFMKKVVKKYTPPKKATSSITRDLKGAFTDKTTFFLQTKSGKMFELPSKKNKKFLVFGKRADELRNHAKANGLNINKEQDLKQLVIYYDNL